MVVVANDPISRCDFDLGGLNLTYFVLASLAITCDPFDRGPHVDRCLPSPPF